MPKDGSTPLNLKPRALLKVTLNSDPMAPPEGCWRVCLSHPSEYVAFISTGEVARSWGERIFGKGGRETHPTRRGTSRSQRHLVRAHGLALARTGSAALPAGAVPRAKGGLRHQGVLSCGFCAGLPWRWRVDIDAECSDRLR